VFAQGRFTMAMRYNFVLDLSHLYTLFVLTSMCCGGAVDFGVGANIAAVPESESTLTFLLLGSGADHRRAFADVAVALGFTRTGRRRRYANLRSLFLAGVVVLVAADGALALALTYPETATGSGALGGTSFTNALIKLMMTTDTSQVEHGVSLFSFFAPITLQVSSIGPATMTQFSGALPIPKRLARPPDSEFQMSNLLR